MNTNCKNFSDGGIEGHRYCSTPEKAGLRVRADGKGRPSPGTCERCKVREPIDASKSAIAEITTRGEPPQPNRHRQDKPWPFDKDTVVHRSLWHPESKPLTDSFVDTDIGLGDVTERMIKLGGFKALAAAKSLSAEFGRINTWTSAFKHLAGRDCGCEDKKVKLNKMYPRSEWIKPRQRLAIWTYADGDYIFAANGLFRSLKQHGVIADFHVYSPNRIPSADYCHDYTVRDQMDRRWWTFKFGILKHEVAKLDADIFLWLDCDSLCVRDPGDITRMMCGDPVHAFLESDMDAQDTAGWSWWGVANKRIAELMREKGVSGRCYGVNGGAFAVRREAIGEFVDRAMDFWRYVHEKTGVYVADEPALAYAVTMMSRDPAAHVDLGFLDLWAREVFSVFGKDLPDARPWTWKQWFRQSSTRTVTPSILHTQRSKQALIENGRME